MREVERYKDRRWVHRVQGENPTAVANNNMRRGEEGGNDSRSTAVMAFFQSVKGTSNDQEHRIQPIILVGPMERILPLSTHTRIPSDSRWDLLLHGLIQVNQTLLQGFAKGLRRLEAKSQRRRGWMDGGKNTKVVTIRNQEEALKKKKRLKCQPSVFPCTRPRPLQATKAGVLCPLFQAHPRSPAPRNSCAPYRRS